jgi:hypothetical protein
VRSVMHSGNIFIPIFSRRSSSRLSAEVKLAAFQRLLRHLCGDFIGDCLARWKNG